MNISIAMCSQMDLKKEKIKMKRGTLGKKILFSILSIGIIITGVLIYINWSFKPLPEEKRNMSTSNVRMLVNMEDIDWRTPIIRTYTKEEFDSFDENEMNKVKGIVSGNVEGDVPILKIENGIGMVEVSFEKIDKGDGFEVIGKIIPDDFPKIKISALDTLYSKEEPKIINDVMAKRKETGATYRYEIKRYFKEGEIYHNENDELFMESMFIEINYEINKESYVSIFAINTIEYKD